MNKSNINRIEFQVIIFIRGIETPKGCLKRGNQNRKYGWKGFVFLLAFPYCFI